MTPIVSIPEPGYYLRQFTRGGPMMPHCKIWLGFGRDPVTGETIERGWCWRAETADGREVPVTDVWPECARNPTTEADYLYRVADAAHARQYRPDDPRATPGRPINLAQMAAIRPPGG